jgi:hypothetical protein
MESYGSIAGDSDSNVSTSGFSKEPNGDSHQNSTMAQDSVADWVQQMNSQSFTTLNLEQDVHHLFGLGASDTYSHMLLSHSIQKRGKMEATPSTQSPEPHPIPSKKHICIKYRVLETFHTDSWRPSRRKHDRFHARFPSLPIKQSPEYAEKFLAVYRFFMDPGPLLSCLMSSTISIREPSFTAEEAIFYKKRITVVFKTGRCGSWCIDAYILMDFESNKELYLELQFLNQLGSVHTGIVKSRTSNQRSGKISWYVDFHRRYVWVETCYLRVQLQSDFDLPKLTPPATPTYLMDDWIPHIEFGKHLYMIDAIAIVTMSLRYDALPNQQPNLVVDQSNVSLESFHVSIYPVPLRLITLLTL